MYYRNMISNLIFKILDINNDYEPVPFHLEKKEFSLPEEKSWKIWKFLVIWGLPWKACIFYVCGVLFCILATAFFIIPTIWGKNRRLCTYDSGPFRFYPGCIFFERERQLSFFGLACRFAAIPDTHGFQCPQFSGFCTCCFPPQHFVKLFEKKPSFLFHSTIPGVWTVEVYVHIVEGKEDSVWIHCIFSGQMRMPWLSTRWLPCMQEMQRVTDGGRMSPSSSGDQQW